MSSLQTEDLSISERLKVMKKVIIIHKQEQDQFNGIIQLGIFWVI